MLMAVAGCATTARMAIEVNTVKTTMYAEPKNIASIDDCYFYHTMDIPNHGTVYGEWDLRGREAAYLGNIELRGARVLEIGTSSGHLCFAMEKMGAEVVAYDLSDEQEWDIVPRAGCNHEEQIAGWKKHLARANNAFWFAHKAYGSRARMVYGTVYEIPDDIGEFDVCTFGSILLHLRDPFLALQRVSAHARSAAVVTDVSSRLTRNFRVIARLLARAGFGMRFLPRAGGSQPIETWWDVSPYMVSEFLKILGFPRTQISFHSQLYHGKEVEVYTVVGRRGAGGTGR